LDSTNVQLGAEAVAAACTNGATFQFSVALGVVLVVVKVVDTGAGLVYQVGGLAHVVEVPIAPVECSATVWLVEAATSALVSWSENVADKIVAPSSADGTFIRKYDRSIPVPV
jgi:hypothetical protein